MNPSTSYRLLEDFEHLEEGDWIIQNGANSMVGQGVIQMAREKGVKTINIIRADRPHAGLCLKHLTNLGGNINITDAYFGTTQFDEILQDLPRPIKLGLNTVGGEAAANLARVLGANASLVTYGAMSRQPVKLPFDVIARKQLKVKGFWMSAWHEAHRNSPERARMLTDLQQYIKDDLLSYPFELHDFDDFDHALKKSQESFKLRKVVLNMDYPDRLAEHDALKSDDYDRHLLPNLWSS